MRPDFDLQFLQFCENEDLRVLCDILTFDNEGKKRLTEGISNRAKYNASYPNNMVGMWKEIAFELQRFGGNSVLNAFRSGSGPAYEKIVYDVCKHLKIDGIGKYDTAEEMEQKLLVAISKKVIGQMAEAEIRSVMTECGIDGYDFTKSGLLAAIMAFLATKRRLFIIVLNSVMRLVSQRRIMMAGMGVLSVGILRCPIGWTLLCGWTAWELMGPAYRITVPAVIQVAYMRTKYQVKSNLDSHCA